MGWEFGVWGGEFGRTPFDNGPGRNHWHRAFSCLLTGSGIRGGLAYGETDDYGMYIARDPVHVHDLHATIFTALGIRPDAVINDQLGRPHQLTFGQPLPLV